MISGDWKHYTQTSDAPYIVRYLVLSTGAVGPSGPAGPQGSVGASGAVGDKGPAGTAGTPGNIILTSFKNISKLGLE